MRTVSVLVVFFVSFSIPLMIWKAVERNAKDARLMMEMGTAKNWAELYRIKNDDYQSFDSDIEMRKVLDDIESMDAEGLIIVSDSGEEYCFETSFRDKKTKPWCVDSTGYLGEGMGLCSKGHANCR